MLLCSCRNRTRRLGSQSRRHLLSNNVLPLNQPIYLAQLGERCTLPGPIELKNEIPNAGPVNLNISEYLGDNLK